MILTLFFFNDTATTEIYTLSLHDALPISPEERMWLACSAKPLQGLLCLVLQPRDRKSTRLNSSHITISYAVFCLKKKKTSMNASGRAKNYTCRRGYLCRNSKLSRPARVDF